MTDILRYYAQVSLALVRWAVLGAMVGVLAGSAAAVFLISLEWATQTRLDNPSLLWGLPLAGLLVGYLYYRFGKRANEGNHLVIAEIHENRDRIPLRMTPFVLVGTLLTHLFGGSAGREGTAVQMGASLADALRRVLRLPVEMRPLLIMAGISGGFGGVFGTPIAGFVFGMEVPSMGKMRYDALVPCLVAAVVGDWTSHAWGATHSLYPPMAQATLEPFLLVKVALASVAFGLVSHAFVRGVAMVKAWHKRFVRYAPFFPVVGGVVVIALTLLVQTQDYLGLSLPLIQQSVRGEGVLWEAFALKLLFTVVTLGSGFMGGEVTPLFVIGATLGYTLGTLLGIDPAWLASVGFVAVFAGASNTPLASALMGIELFGSGALMYVFVACAVAYVFSGHASIYHTQRVTTRKWDS